MIRAFSLIVYVLIVQPALADERILSFDSHIVVEKGGDLVVTEHIKVRAEGNQIRRGIYRDIPRLHQTKWGLQKKKPFEVLSVKKDEKDEPFVSENIGKGGIRIRIGREDVFLEQGVYAYEITYRTGAQLYHEQERDALYWNVNGTEWAFPIDKVTATVVLPEGIEAGKVWAYTGKHGEQGKEYRAEKQGNGATFAATRAFGAGENLTIVVEWPPG